MIASTMIVWMLMIMIAAVMSEMDGMSHVMIHNDID
jgi:hypothetical protein